MNKQQAAEKLINLFGDMNIIGVLHSILVETSKYIIIILFAIYTCIVLRFLSGEIKRENKEFMQGSRK